MHPKFISNLGCLIGKINRKVCSSKHQRCLPAYLRSFANSAIISLTVASPMLALN